MEPRRDRRQLIDPGWDGGRSTSTGSPRVGVAVAAALTAATASALLFVSPPMAFLGAAAVALVVAVAFHPAAAAYIVIGATPLLAGIDRGLLIPLLRPNEALALLVGLGLLARAVPRVVAGDLPPFRLRRIDLSILLMALMGSVVPLLWLALRDRTPTQDDYLYTLTIWKLYGVYLVVRASVKTERQARRCLAVGMASAAVVALIAILQSLKLFGVPQMLSTYYTHFGNRRALEINRGSSTLSLPVAVADLMILNIAVAWGWLRRGTRHRLALQALVATFVFGTLASGQISGAIALALTAATVAYLARNVRPLVAAAPVALAGSIVLWPVISRRLQGFSSPEGLPESWLGRIHNLRTYFFPDLFSNFHWVLGVRPAARVQLSHRLRYVWIESGYTWLLWTGGLPFLLSFVYFVWTNLVISNRLLRTRDDAIGIAATACVVGLVVVAVLMVFDPHLSYRGSADMLFALLALASLAPQIRPEPSPAEPRSVDDSNGSLVRVRATGAVA
ncbi:MAG: hypothetical protein M3326_00480 [Actinomycetota bacterium]|nr:hypothetical protein [Actinomycetota bacterium]